MLQAFRNFLTRRTFAYKARNKAMNMYSSFENFKAIRKKAEDSRKDTNRPHEVLYFHKVDDPYSHLTIHFIEKFKSTYDVKFKSILVGEENPAALHEPSLYTDYCLEDVKRIAELKLPDLNTANVESAMRSVRGTARSMGITIDS